MHDPSDKYEIHLFVLAGSGVEDFRALKLATYLPFAPAPGLTLVVDRVMKRNEGGEEYPQTLTFELASIEYDVEKGVFTSFEEIHAEDIEMYEAAGFEEAEIKLVSTDPLEVIVIDKDHLRISSESTHRVKEEMERKPRQ